MGMMVVGLWWWRLSWWRQWATPNVWKDTTVGNTPIFRELLIQHLKGANHESGSSAKGMCLLTNDANTPCLPLFSLCRILFSHGHKPFVRRAIDYKLFAITMWPGAGSPKIFSPVFSFPSDCLSSPVWGCSLQWNEYQAPLEGNGGDRLNEVRIHWLWIKPCQSFLLAIEFPKVLIESHGTLLW